MRSLCKKDDDEEEKAQFDVETVKKVIINDVSIFLSTVNNLKLPPEFWLGGDKYRVTRTDEVPNALLSRVLSCKFRRFGRKLGRRPSVFSKDVLPNAVLSIDVSVPQIQEQRVEVQRGNPQERLQLRNSGNRQRLQNVWQKGQVECRLPENCGSTSSAVRSVTECSKHPSELARESQNVQTATSGTDKNSQKVPKTVEVSKQQYTVMNVDVPAEMQRQITDTRRWCSKRR